MTQAGYSWTINETERAWTWAVLGVDDPTPLLTGHAPSRAVAAAMVVRALIRGVAAEAHYQGLAA